MKKIKRVVLSDRTHKTIPLFHINGYADIACIWKRMPHGRIELVRTVSPEDMVSYVDNTIGEMTALRDEITRLEAIIKRAKEAIHTHAQVGIQNAPTPADRLQLAAQIYWFWHEIPGDLVLQLLGVKRKDAAKILPKPRVTIQCKRCKGPIEVIPTSRTNYKELKKGDHYIFCQSCQAAQAKAVEESRARIQQKEAEYQAYVTTLKTMPYSEYLQTDHWQTLRSKMLKRAAYACQLCSAKGVLNVHHRTYARRGQEEYSDLIVLCANCHGKFHDKVQGAS